MDGRDHIKRFSECSEAISTDVIHQYYEIASLLRSSQKCIYVTSPTSAIRCTGFR
jgi:hypothetical protein